MCDGAGYVDYDWDWERSERLDGAAQSDGAFACCVLHELLSSYTTRSLERCVLRNGRHPPRDLSTHEQHGGTSGLPVALVHHIPRARLLVLHRRMVVSAIASKPPVSALFPHYRSRVVIPTLVLLAYLSLWILAALLFSVMHLIRFTHHPF